MAVALTDSTAGHLKRKLGELAPLLGERSRGAGGSRVVLVRCTADEPAAASGVGAECYPGAVVRMAASVAVEDQEDAGEVWLTVLAGEAAAEPAVGGLYWCQLAGPLEVGGVTRPRAFGVGTGTTEHASTGATNVTIDNDWLGMVSVTVPAAGVYLIWAGVSASMQCSFSSGAPFGNSFVRCRLYDVTNAAVLPNTERFMRAAASSFDAGTNGNLRVDGSLFMLAVVEVDGPTEFRSEADCIEQADPGGDGEDVGGSDIGYVRLSGSSSAGGGGGLTGTFGG